MAVLYGRDLPGVNGRSEVILEIDRAPLELSGSGEQAMERDSPLLA